jgi:3-hydroxyacyl-CoA dehydrogenase
MGEITDAVDEGTSPEVADNAMRSIGFPMSPFELLGLVGPGVGLHVAKTLHENLGPRYRISPTMEAMVKEGIKTFYIKSDDGSVVANPAAVALIHKGDTPSTAEQVRSRALKALAEEARMMLDEGVVSTPAEIDLCMLMGAGWPMHLGGILPFLDREGISDSVCGSRFHPAGVASLPSK